MSKTLDVVLYDLSGIFSCISFIASWYHLYNLWRHTHALSRTQIYPYASLVIMFLVRTPLLIHNQQYTILLWNTISLTGWLIALILSIILFYNKKERNIRETEEIYIHPSGTSRF
jgi:hypothetical protein